MAIGSNSYSLPDHPLLADVARALRDDGAWGQVFDAEWNFVYVTDELRRTFGGGDLVDFPLGRNGFGPDFVEASLGWRFGANSTESLRGGFAIHGGFMLADNPGGPDGLRETVHPIFHDMIDDLEPRHEVLFADASTGGASPAPQG